MKFVTREKLRLLKDAAKCIYFGAFSSNKLPLYFKGWTDTIVLNSEPSSHSSLPRLIWLFWDTPEKPPLVKSTIARVKSLNPDYDIRLLDTKNISSYIDSSFLSREDITLSHKSDIIRLELLARYGGFWLDATCIFNEDFSWAHAASAENSPDLVAFYRAEDTYDPRFPVIESWFMACPPDNEFMILWRDEFRNVLKLGSKGYFDHVKGRSDFAALKQGIQRPEYLILYIAAQIVLREGPPARLFLRKAEDSPYLYQQQVNWDRVKVATVLCRVKAPSPLPPVVKLTHSNRHLMPFLMKMRLVKQDSILGNFLSALKTAGPSTRGSAEALPGSAENRGADAVEVDQLFEPLDG
jgi:hypothetical protein